MKDGISPRDRAQMAAVIMAGLVQNAGDRTYKQMAESAVKHVDALVLELGKKEAKC